MLCDEEISSQTADSNRSAPTAMVSVLWGTFSSLLHGHSGQVFIRGQVRAVRLMMDDARFGVPVQKHRGEPVHTPVLYWTVPTISNTFILYQTVKHLFRGSLPALTPPARLAVRVFLLLCDMSVWDRR